MGEKKLTRSVRGNTNSDTKTKSRYWCFTYNHDEKTRDKTRWILGELAEEVVYNEGYLCFQQEKGESGNLHFQGFIYFKNPRHFNAVKEYLPGAHLEKCIAPKQAKEYCHKEDNTTIKDTFEEFGKCPPFKQGKRTDVDTAMDMIQEGCTWDEFVMTNIGLVMRYEKFWRKYWMKYNKTPDRDVELIIIWGPSATGKTHWAKKYCDDQGFTRYTKPIGDKQWWDNYMDEEYIIWNEFDPKEYRITDMNQLADKECVQIPFKGGFTTGTWKGIILTSNIDPKNWWIDQPKMVRDAFFRRVTSLLHKGSREREPEGLSELSD